MAAAAAESKIKLLQVVTVAFELPISTQHDASFPNYNSYLILRCSKPRAATSVCQHPTPI
jgi:hypothetical protein